LSLSDTTDRIDDSTFRNHNLEDLCNKCGITPTPDEAKLLQFLEYQTVNGKYPAPFKIADKDKQVRVADLKDADQYAQREIANRLLSRIGSKMESLRQPPTPP